MGTKTHISDTMPLIIGSKDDDLLRNHDLAEYLTK